MEIKKRASRSNKKHQSYMLDFLETHPEMVRANFSQPMARQHYNNLWQELTINLNAMGLSEKTVTQWQKTFGDWCTKTKSKINVSTGHMNKTGGGPNSGIELSDLEMRLMALKGWSCVHGDNQTEEAGFGAMEAMGNRYETSDLTGLNIIPAIKINPPIQTSTSTGPTMTSAGETAEPNSQESSVYKDYITQQSMVRTTPTSSKRQRMTTTKNTEPNTQQTSSLSSDSMYTKSAPARTPSKKLDMETMHYQTLTVLKEINQNLIGMNDGIRGIKDALNEQVAVFKTLRDLVANNEK